MGVALALIVAVVVPVVVAGVLGVGHASGPSNWLHLTIHAVLDIGELALNILVLRVDFILQLVIGQRDVLEELYVQEDGQLVKLLHEYADFVVHCLR